MRQVRILRKNTSPAIEYHNFKAEKGRSLLIIKSFRTNFSIWENLLPCYVRFLLMTRHFEKTREDAELVFKTARKLNENALNVSKLLRNLISER